MPLSATSTARPAVTSGRVEIVATTVEGTQLRLPGAAGRTVTVAGWPDVDGAARAAEGFDRVLWLRLGIDPRADASVAGIRRRRPLNRRVGLDTALGLIEAGVPTIVRTRGADR